MARKILLADDSVTAQNMGRRILADAGYDVITVNNGSAALKKAIEQKPDVIVLDVYMPGYGGLEVCQRLRETSGVSRIPVLLTVGKLEPFKPEEAQRVRADAFVIKPFEASELLAALAKLEDKIVPEGAAPKAKSFRMDSSGAIAVQDEEFGDMDGGWKNRLSMPPAKKQDGGEAEASKETADSQAKSASDREKQKIKEAAKETKAVEAVPADITPEEVAAIAAAAQAVSQKSGDANDTAASAATSTNSEKSVAAECSASVAQQSEASPSTKEAAAAVQSSPSAEAEVVEAVSRLAPEVEAEKKEAPALVAVGAAVGEGTRGPRWAAQEIPVPEQESASLLMHEMEKMHAAMAAAEGKNGSTYMPPRLPEVEVKVEPVIAESAIAPATGKAEPVESVSSETVAATAPPAALGEAAKSEIAQVIPEPRQVEKDVVPSQPPADRTSAYAAAASVGSDSTNTKASSSDGDEAPKSSDLAAAWQNWQSVRESILGSPIAAQITEVAAETLKAAQPAPSSAPPAETAAESESPNPGNPTAIASIVDSVLAELRPKIVEEIAKKLGSEKK